MKEKMKVKGEQEKGKPATEESTPAVMAVAGAPMYPCLRIMMNQMAYLRLALQYPQPELANWWDAIDNAVQQLYSAWRTIEVQRVQQTENKPPVIPFTATR